MGDRRFADRAGKRWDVVVRSRSEWVYEPVEDNPGPARAGEPPGYETDPFELSVEELQHLQATPGALDGPCRPERTDEVVRQLEVGQLGESSHCRGYLPGFQLTHRASFDRCRPSEVRSAIRSLSNSATPESTVRISFPIAVDVLAQGSANDRKLASFAAVALMMLSRSRVDLARRSSRVTTNVSLG